MIKKIIILNNFTLYVYVHEINLQEQFKQKQKLHTKKTSTKKRDGQQKPLTSECVNISS